MTNFDHVIPPVVADRSAGRRANAMCGQLTPPWGRYRIRYRKSVPAVYRFSAAGAASIVNACRG